VTDTSSQDPTNTPHPASSQLWAGAEGQARAVASGEISAAQLTEAVLARIEAVDPVLNAFTVVMAEEARAQAAERDGARSRGEDLGPLHGVPVAIKEENDVAGTVTTFGGSANRSPALRDGLVTQRLREAGAVVVGKTNMPEFGQHPFTESERFGNTGNPWNPDHTPGGSSGGTAAAVAAGMVAVGIGGDGGGSIRIPSACCGLYGLKPTRGRVSTAPHPDLWCALGTVGPLTRSVVDSALVYDVIRGNVPGDRYSAAQPATSFLEAARLTTAESQRKLRIGWSTRAVTRGVKPAPEHVQAVLETAAALEGLGHEVFEIDPRYPDPTTAFVPQFFAGVRTEAALVEHPERLERRTRQAVAMGAWARPRVVARAVRQGERIAATVDERVFARCDVLLTPTIPKRPPHLGVLDGTSALTAMLKDIPMVGYTALWNVTGHPAASLPAGFAGDGMPTAVQLVGRRNDEVTLLALSAQLESVRPWADRRPGL
jgi:amidase